MVEMIEVSEKAAPVVDYLLEVISSEPLPTGHTSSHWKEFGQKTQVEQRGNSLLLKASGFETVAAMSLMGRLLHAVERATYYPVTSRLKSFREIWHQATKLTRELGAHPNFYVLKSACALAVLTDHWKAFSLAPSSFALIGDGYGFLGALIRRCVPDTRLYCIDLPKTLVFQARTHGIADPAATMVTMASGKPADVHFVLPQQVEAVQEDIDCAINMASMGEMNAFSVEGYFKFLRRRSGPNSRFYCINRLRKELPGGEISSFMDYPWEQEDTVFLDGACPYYRYFFSPYKSPSGPEVAGIRVPYVNYFDGAFLHRLVHLAREG